MPGLTTDRNFPADTVCVSRRSPDSFYTVIILYVVSRLPGQTVPSSKAI